MLLPFVRTYMYKVNNVYLFTDILYHCTVHVTLAFNLIDKLPLVISEQRD